MLWKLNSGQTSTMSMTTVTFGSVPGSSAEDERKTDGVRRRLPLIDAYLKEQQTLTAVERFAKLHESPDTLSLHSSKFYRDLIPLEKPQPDNSTPSRSTSTPVPAARPASWPATT